MKKCVITWMIVTILTLCIGCAQVVTEAEYDSSKAEIDLGESIVGYWLSSDCLSSLAFDNRGKVVVDEIYIGEYSIYDKNKITINVDTPTFDNVYDVWMSAVLMIEDGILQITDRNNGEVYRYYSKEKVESLLNLKYWDKNAMYDGNLKSSVVISHPDDWSLNIEGEGAFLEGVTSTDELKKGCKEALTLFEEEILPLYCNSIIEDSEFTYQCNDAEYMWDEVLFSVSIYVDDIEYTYIINPDNENIYVYDLEGYYLIPWDGMIQGCSILNKI